LEYLCGRPPARPLEKPDVPQGDAEPRQAELPQAIDHQADDLRIGRDIIGADQLGPDLEDFLLAAGVLRLIAEHGRPIAQPQGQSALHHAHRDDPGDLGRHVGTQQQDPAGRALGKLEALLDEVRLQAGGEDVEVLERGRNDLLVASSAERSQQPVFE
jgi:hypothetical protein